MGILIFNWMDPSLHFFNIWYTDYYILQHVLAHIWCYLNFLSFCARDLLIYTMITEDWLMLYQWKQTQLYFYVIIFHVGMPRSFMIVHQHCSLSKNLRREWILEIYYSVHKICINLLFLRWEIVILPFSARSLIHLQLRSMSGGRIHPNLITHLAVLLKRTEESIFYEILRENQIFKHVSCKPEVEYFLHDEARSWFTRSMTGKSCTRCCLCSQYQVASRILRIL